MASRPEGWHELPDSILLMVCLLKGSCMRLLIQFKQILNFFPQIMAALDHVTVASTCALVCKSWLRVSGDKLLWRALLARDFSKTESSLREAADTEISWIAGKTQNGCSCINRVLT